MKIAVIGSGVGGLSVAIRLANKGHEVELYEKNSTAGGKLSQIRVDGYRFDTGPSLFTLPQLLEELFDECGESLADYMTYSLLENNCKYFFADGSDFNFYHDKEKLRQEVESKTTEQYAAVEQRLRESGEVYKFSAPVFIFNDFHDIRNFTSPAYKNILFKLHRLNFMKTMHQANKKDFSDARLIQLFDRYATYNGSNPYKAPATLNMIAHLENNIGAFFPARGMYQIVESLYKLALKKGVTFHFDTPVEKIVVADGRVKGVVIAGELINYDAVVSDVDVKYLANNMFEDPLKKRLNKAEPSSSALIFYWGIKQKFPNLDVHNILFSADYKSEFKHIFEDKTIGDDPTVYIFISSKIVEGDAPEGCENWFTMINVPADTGQDWDKLIANARKSIIAKINKRLGIDIEPLITCEHIASPITIYRNTHSMGGALYGTSSNSKFAAFLRHPNSLRKVKGIYFVGGSVHPGGGIPLCVASSQIVSKKIKP